MGYSDSDFQAVENENKEVSDFCHTFLKDAQSVAKGYIEVFFKDKEHYHGGKIKKEYLYSEKNLSRVLNTDVSSGILEAYSKIKNHPDIVIDEDENAGIITDDVRLSMSIFDQCSKRGIPKQFAGGILLMYLDLCEGIV